MLAVRTEILAHLHFVTFGETHILTDEKQKTWFVNINIVKFLIFKQLFFYLKTKNL